MTRRSKKSASSEEGCSRTKPHGSKLLSALFGDHLKDDVICEESLGKDQLEILKYSKNCIEANPGIRVLTMLYAERKFVFFFLVHFVCTMLCWQHFMYTKFHVTMDTVPEGAHRYWWKRMIPALEFGSMHAILFQIALIPITMSRYTITSLSRTSLSKVVPFNHMTAMHIHLGYTTVLIVLLATITFFIFFGTLCEEQKTGEEPRPEGQFSFCDKFTEEIMNTGYGLIAIMLIIMFTSFFRHKIPYEAFYAVHHLVFGMFGLAVAHTFDDKFRQGATVRSQTYKWFASTLVWYLTDRLYMWSTRSSMVVTELIALGDDDEVASKGGQKEAPHRVIILRVKKPVTFGYVPGQYASLRIPSVDMHWHPFSIASEPSQSCLEFYMMVAPNPSSWTARLWAVAKASNTTGVDLPFKHVEVLGPYGTCIDTSSHMHLCGIGAGTGIVPMLSTLKATVSQLCQLNPESHAAAEAGLRESAKELVVQRKQISKSFRHITRRSLSSKDMMNTIQPLAAEDVERGLQSVGPQSRKGVNNKRDALTRKPSSMGLESSMTSKGAVNTELLRSRMRKLWLKEIVKLVFLVAPVWELMMSGFIISWHTGDYPPTEVMEYFLKVGTILCTVNFGVIWLASFEALFFEAWIDILFLGVSIFSTLWWCADNTWGHFNTLQICAFLGLSAYRGLRTWTIANSSLNDGIQSQVAKLGVASLVKTSSMQLVWICRDPTLVEFLWPEIDAYWTKLQATWGNRAGKVVDIQVYVTTTDTSTQKRLKRTLGDSSLYESGALKFGRPDIFDIVQGQLLNRVRDDATAGGMSAASSTLVAFCGSPSLGSVVSRDVMNVQIIAEATKHGHHTMSFYQENYGIIPTPRKQNVEDPDMVPSDQMQQAKSPGGENLQEEKNGDYRCCKSAECEDALDMDDCGIEINGIEINLGLDETPTEANGGLAFY